MSSSSRSRWLVASLLAPCAVAFAGCNELLDNRPADVGDDLFATEPAGDAAPSTHEAARDVDASRPSSDPEEDAGARPASPECLVGTKPCGGVCVATSNPLTGCGGPTCDACTFAHAASMCVDAQCTRGPCEPGWADCNGLASDGCEVDLSSPASCGACDVACTPRKNADVACTAGMCTAQCQAGFGDCNLDAADGCERSLLKDRHNCGQCGRFCIFGRCEDGTCVVKP